MRNPEKTIGTLARYLEQTLHLETAIAPWKEASLLPAYLVERYYFYEFGLDGRQIVIMLDRGRERIPPAAIGKHRQQVARFWSEGIIYASETLSATNRSRLVAAGVPFIIPGRQLYMPPLGIDLRERFNATPTSSTSLSPMAQLIVLGVALGRRWGDCSATELAGRLSSSKMTVGRAYREIEAADLATTALIGKTKRLHFAHAGKQLWQASLPFLQSPVKSETEKPVMANDSYAVLAGFSALSRYTSLAAPEMRIVAARWTNPSRDEPWNNAASTADHSSSETIVFQRWRYDPLLLASDGCVDRLSLYLSLRGNADERVEKAFDELLGGVTW